MARAPLMSGGVIVEVSKGEYDELVRIAERVDTVERLVNSDSFFTTDNILTALDIKKKTETENAN